MRISEAKFTVLLSLPGMLLSAYWAHVPCPYQPSHSLELCSTCPFFTICIPHATVPAALGNTELSPCEPVSHDTARCCRRLGVPLPLLPEVSNFRPRVYLKGSLVIALVRVCVCPSVRLSVFKFLRDCSLVFSSFLHGVRAP